ncbi:MAG: hypothetical protein HZB38_13435 [Planctomycetes bacterium]|nr:hypothetical protein [Planctomycetota bacterium]
MSKNVRVIIVNTDEEVSADLRAVLLSISGVKIVAEIDEPALLPQALDSFPAEALLIHLDPAPAAMMDVVAPLIEARKNRVSAIAMTEDKDPDLLLRALRCGVKDILHKPFPPDQLRDVLLRVAGEGGTTGKRLGRLISVVGTGGGVGATQIATNVGVEIAQLDTWKGQPESGGRPRVAVVDLDFRTGQVATQLDAQPTYTIAELCETAEQIDTQMIERAVYKHPTGVHVLARPTDIAQIERISAGQCAGALAALQEHYDYLVVDLPARFDPTTRAVFDMSDIYMLAFQLLVPYVRTADRMLQDLLNTGYAMDRVKLVCTRYDGSTGYLELSDVEATLKRKVDFLIPSEWKTSAGAVNMGSPLLLMAPKSKLRLAYRAIATAIASSGQDDDQPGAAPGSAAPVARKGLFGGLFAGSKT